MEGPEGLYMICGKSDTTIQRNIIGTLVELTGGLVRHHRGARELTFMNRKISIVGANDERAQTKIQGSTLAGAYIDEATVIPEGFFQMLLSRLSVPGSKLFATCNPESPYHWLKTGFIDRCGEINCKFFDFKITDNPSLSPDKIAEWRKAYRGLWYKRYIEGEWVQAEGAIFDFFDEAIHVVKSPKTYAKYYILGIDYGTTNPFACVLLGFNDDVAPAIWVEKEYYWDSKEMGFQKTDTEYANDVHREFSAYSPRLIYLDPAAASFEVELKRQKMPVKQAKNDVIDGIRFVSSMLTQGDLVICKGCHHLIKEISGYIWDAKSGKDGIDRPVKQRDHAVDALRYALYSHWGARHTLRETKPEDIQSKAEQAKWAKNPMAYPGFTNSHGWQTI